MSLAKQHILLYQLFGNCQAIFPPQRKKILCFSHFRQKAAKTPLSGSPVMINARARQASFFQNTSRRTCKPGSVGRGLVDAERAFPAASHGLRRGRNARISSSLKDAPEAPLSGSPVMINARARRASFLQNTSRRTCKPGSVERGHLSTLIVTDKFKRYSRLHSGGQPCVNTAQPCIGRGLHGTGRYRPVGELLPRLSILTAKAAVYFCCTFLEVAFT